MARRRDEEKILDVNASMQGDLVFSDPVNSQLINRIELLCFNIVDAFPQFCRGNGFMSLKFLKANRRDSLQKFLPLLPFGVIKIIVR
mgnify:CR=1 FL=1